MNTLTWVLLGAVVLLCWWNWHLERGLKAQAFMIGRLVKDTNWVRKLNLPPEAQ